MDRNKLGVLELRVLIMLLISLVVLGRLFYFYEYVYFF